MNILDDLSSYKEVFVPLFKDSGEEIRLRMLRFLETTAYPSSRTTLEGHFTVSSVLLHPKSKSVYLIYHQKLGKWLQPGGHVEDSDFSLLDAAQRECVEETEIESLEPWLFGSKGAPFDLDIHEIPARQNEPAHLHFDLCYLFLTHELRGSSSQLRFGSIADLLATELDESVKKKLKKVEFLLEKGLIL